MTRIKPLFIAGALTLASFGIASAAKSYDIMLSSPAKLGANQLKAGDYRVKVAGNQATITDMRDNKSVTVTVKVEHEGQKFDQTSVQTRDQNGVNEIFQINLGGSDTKLELTD